MTVYLCSCGFATDDGDWFDGHQFQHPDHYRRVPAPSWQAGTSEPALSVPVAPGRAHDVARLTAGELERTRRELQASLALARPGSLARAPILAQLAAIDAELAGRAADRPDGLPGSSSLPGYMQSGYDG